MSLKINEVLFYFISIFSDLFIYLKVIKHDCYQTYLTYFGVISLILLDVYTSCATYCLKKRNRIYKLTNMKNIKMLKKIILFTIITINFCGHSQTLKKVTELENKHQDCLDSGIGMKNCSINFYSTSDSLLNIAYKNLKVKLNLTEQNALKTEQKIWLKKRDAYFVKAYKETINEYGNSPESNDFKMIYFDMKSDFVIMRVKELIKRRMKIK
jgi:uncharacterized protein YecT (DUF1311 family)